MTPDEREFERFSGDLDREWIRARLRERLGSFAQATDEEAIVRELQDADPLRPSRKAAGLDAVRQWLAPWPARVALAAAASVLLVVGVLLGRTVDAPRGGVAAVTVPKPPYQPGRGTALGLGTASGDAATKFREAMALHPEPDFPQKALPLLREAVAADPSSDEAHFWLGVALLLDERPGEAIAPLERAVALGRASRQYREYLVFAYLRTGAVEKALIIQAELLRTP